MKLIFLTEKKFILPINTCLHKKIKYLLNHLMAVNIFICIFAAILKLTL